jgi:hypothetical protein
MFLAFGKTDAPGSVPLYRLQFLQFKFAFYVTYCELLKIREEIAKRNVAQRVSRKVKSLSNSY